MANNYTQTTIEPPIPAEYLTPTIQKDFNEAGIEIESWGDKFYCFARYGINSEYENYVYKLLQKIFKQMLKNKLKPIPFAVQSAFTCDKMRPGEFGGAAVVITDKVIKEFSTFGFINTVRLRYKNRGIRR